MFVFFFKQKTAYEMRISYWSSDVCSSDLMGSQISNVRDIARGMREATRYFVELSQLGAVIDYVDVGGGLGIDYEGTRSRSYNSVNYGVAQYASSIVQPLADACAANE